VVGMCLYGLSRLRLNLGLMRLDTLCIVGSDCWCFGILGYLSFYPTFILK